ALSAGEHGGALRLGLADPPLEPLGVALRHHRPDERVLGLRVPRAERRPPVREPPLHRGVRRGLHEPPPHADAALAGRVVSPAHAARRPRVRGPLLYRGVGRGVDAHPLHADAALARLVVGPEHDALADAVEVAALIRVDDAGGVAAELEHDLLLAGARLQIPAD